MAGVGKTTLAQLVYNDDRIESHFGFKAWVSVSEDFDIINITETILCSIGAETGNINDLNLLQVKLKQKLSEVKYLLVLDDIWNENPNYWATLSQPFEAGLRGSKIIVTTRNRGVSSMVGTLPAHQLKELSNEACLCIFTQHSLGRTDFNMHPHLKEIGEKIVKRCDGLPLAAKSLGGLLHGKYDINEWENVLNSKMWALPEEKCDIIPALKVSYYYLSSHLKRCFAYCSLFPKGYEFEMENIILLWMAEGLLQPENNVKKMEELGRDYFCELKSRSFFEESKSSRSVFVMHDLIHDLT
ncbi:putative disease resistance RPP13-like protein 1 [Pistacia vera]|nr:putative disease resistance RPP13-like protein 1 [Pistacia vera]